MIIMAILSLSKIKMTAHSDNTHETQKYDN